jgi:hypothetical protein
MLSTDSAHRGGLRNPPQIGAARIRWPFDVAKKLASGVPKCGVFIIVTVRKRGNQSRVAAVAA